MRIAVASGKGGTGKTTVAIGLALSLPNVQFIDADAEEPNAHLFLHPVVHEAIPVCMTVPEIDSVGCTLCGACAEFCRFNALAVVGGEVLVFPELCHGCGGCVYACPQGAVREKQRQIGEVRIGAVAEMCFIDGRLRPGEPSAVQIVREEIRRARSDRTTIIDAPPGTACAVQEVIAGSDFCLLVTEPTPFGLHDLRMALDLAAELGVPAGVVINRSGPRDSIIEGECQSRGVPVMLRIPLDRRIAEAYSRGETLVGAFPEYAERLRELHRAIHTRAAA